MTGGSEEAVTATTAESLIIISLPMPDYSRGHVHLSLLLGRGNEPRQTVQSVDEQVFI
jgi:hypothetical protein